MRLIAVLFVAAMILVACTPWRAQYFAESLNKATQDDIVGRVGPPTTTHGLSNGGTVWQYRYYDSSVVGSRGNIVGGTDCIEYILTFDTARVLKNWVRQGC